MLQVALKKKQANKQTKNPPKNKNTQLQILRHWEEGTSQKTGLTRIKADFYLHWEEPSTNYRKEEGGGVDISTFSVKHWCLLFSFTLLHGAGREEY